MHNFRSIYIDQIAVLSQYQMTGAGRLLMEQAEKLAKEHSITHLTLEHWTDNTIAASYFRKKGFAPYRERLMKTIDV
jgi:ribosomal protein S18 acetylase RimI-like enzyme